MNQERNRMEDHLNAPGQEWVANRSRAPSWATTLRAGFAARRSS